MSDEPERLGRLVARFVWLTFLVVAILLLSEVHTETFRYLRL